MHGVLSSNPMTISDSQQQLIDEELKILSRIKLRLKRDAEKKGGPIENLDAQLIELRDAVAEAKEEDVASLVEQMHQVAALSAKRGQGRSVPVDPASPYFGHLEIKDVRRGTARHVLVGKRTLLDDGEGLSIIYWRNAPISRLYYRYEEGDEYEEEFDSRVFEGKVLLRRSLAVNGGDLRRINAPQGAFAVTKAGEWRELSGTGRPALEGGVGKAARIPRGQLGVHDEADVSREDKHLQEITALIDREQFEMITQPEAGVVLIQGGAGSGKTTVALHRVAYLAFRDPVRFAPKQMAVIVFNEALVEYIRHVLPSLGIEGVQVTTYRRWSAALLKRSRLTIPDKRTDDTPEAVARFKKHPVVLRLIDKIVEKDAAGTTRLLAARMAPYGRDGGQLLEGWTTRARLPLVARFEKTIESVRAQRHVPARVRSSAEVVLSSRLEEARDVVSDWIDMLGDAGALRASIEMLAPGDFSELEIGTITRWCSKRSAELIHYVDFAEAENEARERGDADVDFVDDRVAPPALDDEDDAIFLRLLQAKYGGIFLGRRRYQLEHIVIDEAQDLCPLEVRVLLDCSSEGRSITVAGDKAQKMIFNNGFVSWPQLLADAGLPHVEIQPLKITYRSTQEVMRLAQEVLGDLRDEDASVVARSGAPVGYYDFGDQGESVAFLGEALRNLMIREPSASVAVICRYPQQAKMYYEGLHLAEVPRVRLVARQDFSFKPGIDVTDIRQVKGLEFDYVVLMDPTEQNYPSVDASRHLLHIAATRTAYQLWIVCTGIASKLLPTELIDAGVFGEASSE